ATVFTRHAGHWETCADIADEIISTLVERPPITIGDEPSVRGGVDSSLDEWRALRDGGKDGIARIQSEERARTGINSLKVGYNKILRYFLEVSHTQNLRLFNRGNNHHRSSRTRRLSAPADAGRRRAVCHEIAQGVRGKSSHR